MGFFGNLFHTLVPISNLFHKDAKKKKEPTLQDILAPYLQNYTDTMNKYSGQADVDYGKATVGYDQAMKYYQDILSGNRDNLLQQLDASQITNAIDEQERQNYELAPRGGRRAATAANLGFSKFAELNRYLQQLRGAAPQQLANLAQAYAGMGQGKLAAALGGTAGATNILFGEEQINQQEKDRKANLIGSIIGAAGSILGTLACNPLDTWILTPKGYKQLKELNVGDRVCTVAPGGKIEEAKIIRKEIKEQQDVYDLICDNTSVSGTLSHIFAGTNDTEISMENIAANNPLLPFVVDEELSTTAIKLLKKRRTKEDVAILKLNNEKENFNYITNGLISIDADCLG